MTDSSNNAHENLSAKDYLETQTGPAPVGTVIWLHGLGADATDFEPLVPMLKLPMDTRFIFPNAPERAITINAGMRMRGWYDIDPNDPDGAGADIQASVEAIKSLLQAEHDRGVPADRIVLAGFSQGGVIALQLALSYPQRLAGIMALSTYVHDHEQLAQRVSFANADVPIFMAHGSADPMIPIARAVTGRTALEALGYRVDWHSYGMGHQVCPEEITHISQWLQTVLA
ncbi:MAG: alpha/beta hydrolase [Pseudomonadales bacterium]